MNNHLMIRLHEDEIILFLPFDDVARTHWVHTFADTLLINGFYKDIFTRKLYPDNYADIKTAIGIGYNIYSSIL